MVNDSNDNDDLIHNIWGFKSFRDDIGLGKFRFFVKVELLHACPCPVCQQQIQDFADNGLVDLPFLGIGNTWRPEETKYLDCCGQGTDIMYQKVEQPYKDSKSPSIMDRYFTEEQRERFRKKKELVLDYERFAYSYKNMAETRRDIQKEVRGERTVPANPTSVGEMLRHEFMDPMFVSSKKLAGQMGVESKIVRELRWDRRELTEDLARRLGKAFNISYDFWELTAKHHREWKQQQRAKFDTDEDCRRLVTFIGWKDGYV